MSVLLIIKGFLAGFFISMPLGPAALLIIRRTVNKNRKSGYITALGAITSDSVYAIAAGFGVSFLIEFLKHYQTEIQIIGGIFLFLVGLYFFRSHPLKTIQKSNKAADNHYQHYFSGLLVAFSNPLILIAYIGVFAGTGIVFRLSEIGQVFVIVASFIFGAFSWWLILINTINVFRHRFNLSVLYWFNKISGIILMLFVIISAIIILIKGSPQL